MCHHHVRVAHHRFIKDLLCLGEYALRYTEASTPDLSGRVYVRSASEKHIPVFTKQPHTPETQNMSRLLESAVLVFRAKK